MTSAIETALSSHAWPFQEAQRIVDRLGGKPPAKGYVLFETGYGPSGLPHIGTFGEVARTSMVRRAFQLLMPNVPTRLFAFSDDMDGLRKVPDNVPNPELLRDNLNKPLTKVPDPFGKFDSFGHHNNAMLRGFLDSFNFEYEFQSATDWYMSGRFDATLRLVLERYDEVMAIMLPSLRAERAATYSPFLPICPLTGVVLQVPVVERNVAKGTIVYEEAGGRRTEVPVTGGHCKLQWKADWAMRWTALGVDYEMSGKDLIDSVKLSGAICRALGGKPPENLTYELFLDDKGEKISKSKGNGLTIDQWLTYASPESLSLFMYQKPKVAKRLHFDVIPRAVDDYLSFLEKFPTQEDKERYGNPVWHIHRGHPPVEQVPLTFGILMNLAGVANTEDKAVMWGFLARYVPGATPFTHPLLDRLVGYALRYYIDFIKPSKQYRAPTDMERAALLELVAALRNAPPGASGEDIQNEVYEIGKRHAFESLRHWFGALYEVLLGQQQGPRMGSFFALYGVRESIALIEKALSGADMTA